MESREIIVEPYQGQWLAFFRGDRHNRVIGDTPEEARTLLAALVEELEEEQRQIAVQPPQRSPWPLILAGACVILSLAAWFLWDQPSSSATGHHVQWAHHRTHSAQPK